MEKQIMKVNNTPVGTMGRPRGPSTDVLKIDMGSMSEEIKLWTYLRKLMESGGAWHVNTQQITPVES